MDGDGGVEEVDEDEEVAPGDPMEVDGVGDAAPAPAPADAAAAFAALPPADAALAAFEVGNGGDGAEFPDAVIFPEPIEPGPW